MRHLGPCPCEPAVRYVGTIERLDDPEHQGLFPALFDSSPDGLLVVRPDGVIELANRAAAVIFGTSIADLVGASVDVLVPAPIGARHAAHVAAYFTSPERRPMGTGLELSARHADGSSFPVEVSLSPIDLAGEPHVIAAVRDVTEQREAQAGMTLLRERERIARDIHDMVIQRVFAAGMSLQAIRTAVDSPVARDRLDAVTDELDTTIRELRAAIFRLGTPDEHRTVVAQLHASIDERSRVLGFAPVVTTDGELDALPERVVEQLVAVVTEALSNVARHADASSVEVRVEVSNGRVSLVVVDDGVGIGPEPTPRGGLRNMMWRASELGGECAVAPHDPVGTRLVWSVPVGAEG